MRSLALPSGRVVEVMVQHHHDPTQQALPKKKRTKSATAVGMVYGEVSYTAMSECSHDDQFNRRAGRKAAANKLLENLRLAGFTREDRQAIFDFICPEYRKPKQQPKQEEPTLLQFFNTMEALKVEVQELRKKLG